MKTEIYIFSNIGNTPITKRKGAYCDELRHEFIECAHPSEAREYVKALLASVPHAYDGHFSIPEYWNQNTRNGWVLKSDLCEKIVCLQS